jgi:IS30 family transposase
VRARAQRGSAGPLSGEDWPCASLRAGVPAEASEAGHEPRDEPGVAGKVEPDLEEKCSPEQIVGRLRVEFPDDPEMKVSTETIYQSLCVQSRGALRRDLAVCLRIGRVLRRPSRKVGQRKNRIPNMINIAERPAEVADRAVPGHWESQWCCQAAEARAGGFAV